MDDVQAKVRTTRARVITWKHAENACDCENRIVILEGDKPRRSLWYLEGKCGRCHQTVRLYVKRGRERFLIDPTTF